MSQSTSVLSLNPRRAVRSTSLRALAVAAHLERAGSGYGAKTSEVTAEPGKPYDWLARGISWVRSGRRPNRLRSVPSS